MKNDEIRDANRRALPKFLLLMAALLFIGFVGGFLASWYGLNALAGAMRDAGAFFGMYIAPWLMAAMALIMPAVCIPLYRGAKKRIGSWDGEDEALYGTIDRRLSTAIWASNAILILTYFLLAASYSYGFAIFESTKMLVLFFIAVAALFAVVIETVIIGQKCVDATKMLNPEKKGSFYDIKFQKKWIDSCDEAEKLLIGRCAFKAYAATNKACALLAGALAICALLFNIGFLPSLAVCLIWCVNQSVYYREAMRYSRAGNTLS